MKILNMCGGIGISRFPPFWLYSELSYRKSSCYCLQREVERKYRITSKQYVEGGVQLRVISEIQPELECVSVPATLEEAYIYMINQYE